MFTVGDEEYLVEPLWNTTTSDRSTGHPHVVYKRSDVKLLSDWQCDHRHTSTPAQPVGPYHQACMGELGLGLFLLIMYRPYVRVETTAHTLVILSECHPFI